MRNQVIKTGIKAREELAKGAKFLASAVGRTLGPYGENFRLQKGKRITNDGVSIAREIQISSCVEHSNIKDCRDCSPEIQNEGADALREAAIKCNDEAGDGTTTAITLAWSIYQACTRFLSKEGVIGQKTPSEIVRQIEKERIEITEKLKAISTPIDTKEKLISSALVAVEDKDLAEIIGTAQWELGQDGYLLAEESNDRISSVEKVHGVRIDNGFGTSLVINNQEKQTLEVDNVRVILTSYTLHDLKPIEKVLEQLVKSGFKDIVILARAFTPEAIKVCMQNTTQGNVRIYPMNAPYIDMEQKMLDLASVLAAKYYGSENSNLEDMQILDVGYAKKIVSGRMEAVITGLEDVLTIGRINDRAEELKQKMDGSNSDFERNLLRERIAQLTNGFAIIKVGSVSDIERKRLYDKCEDAVNAVRAAFQEGTVKGGGLAFKEISDALPDDYLLKRPLLAVYEQIISTAPQGFVIEEWVRDPVKVLRIALEKACSAASSFATAGGAIAVKNSSDLDQLLRKQNGAED